MNRAALKRLCIAVACGIAGLAVNTWRTDSAGPLLLGRIITLPVALLYGPWYGALAAIIEAFASRGAYSAATILLPIEALVIGAFARAGRSPLLGGFIVWTAAAAILIAVPRLYGLGYLRQTILPVALQVVVSGLVAVVI